MYSAQSIEVSMFEQGSQNGLLQEFLGSEDKNQSKALLQAVLQNLSDGIGEALGNGTLLCCDPLQIKPKAIDAQSLQLAVKRKALQQQLDRYTQVAMFNSTFLKYASV